MEQIDLYSFSGNFHISPLSDIYLDCVCVASARLSQQQSLHQS